jgi:hypothetical protein
MRSHPLPHTCLSTEKHDKRVVDVILHYFGCLRTSERKGFYDELPEKSRQRIDREWLRIGRIRSRLEFEPDSTTGAILKTFKERMNDWRSVNGRRLVDARQKLLPPHDLDDGVDADIKAPMIFFKDSRPYNIPGVENTFPNQKISIKELLADKEDTNPLMQPCDDNMIRYFHLPANNMIWVEVRGTRYVFSVVYLETKKMIHRKQLHVIITKCAPKLTTCSSKLRTRGREPKRKCCLGRSFGRASSTLTTIPRSMLDT